ncbi:uncharacterized protein LOC126909366 [Daktulosphaira vitifoliae]|uniref:uncharacterized protein LOC126909366 n=1 Tax=Daktulosphaira vitifoliae TaxID=58002 RepID=UPI0021AA61CA|nr:uncharacterized protein LOC126909366 [Daktulosphaira vitifoliae]
MLIKILIISFILSLNLNNFVLSKSQLNCYYSKYMLYYLETKLIYFEKIASKNPTPVSIIEEFENEIKSLGEVVLTLLENIYYENESSNNFNNPYSFATGLLTLNLYLNNICKTLRIQTYLYLTKGEKKLTGYKIFINEFDKYCGYIINCLKHSIIFECYNGNYNPQTFCYDSYYDNKHPKYDYLIKLLPKESDYNKKHIVNSKLEKLETLKKLDEAHVEFKRVIMEKPQRNSHTVDKIKKQLHPSSILLSGLFQDKRPTNGIDQLTGSSDPMDLFRRIYLNVKLKNGNYANITTLFEMMQRYFVPSCIFSYQQQILAATIHPVYSLIGTLANLLKKVYFSEAEGFSEIETRSKVFESQLNVINESINVVIENLVDLKIFPVNLQIHLEATLMHFKNISKCICSDNVGNLKLRWIDQLYYRCVRAMSFNLLYFDVTVKNIQFYNKDECNEVIIRLNNKIKEVQSYVQNLSYYKEDYHNIIHYTAVFSRSCGINNFLDCNIIEKNNSGYCLMKNN